MIVTRKNVIKFFISPLKKKKQHKITQKVLAIIHVWKKIFVTKKLAQSAAVSSFRRIKLNYWWSKFKFQNAKHSEPWQLEKLLELWQFVESCDENGVPHVMNN
jgi:hypothetical protein